MALTATGRGVHFVTEVRERLIPPCLTEIFTLRKHNIVKNVLDSNIKSVMEEMMQPQPNWHEQVMERWIEKAMQKYKT